MFDKKQALKKGPANLLPYYNNIFTTKLPQELEILPLELELQEATKALDNNGGDNIDHLHMLPTFLDTKSSNLGNLNIESISRKSQTRQ